METSNIEIDNLSEDLFNTSTPPQENHSYGLGTTASTNNLDAINYEQIAFIDSTVEDYQTLAELFQTNANLFDYKFLASTARSPAS